MSIKQGDEYRKCLYKYRPLIGNSSDDINLNTLKLLENGELYFSKPSDFNDPFDAKIDYDSSADENQLRNYFTKIKQQFAGTINSNFDIDVLIEKINNGEIDKAMYAPSNSEYANSTRIFCLAKDEKNILMWSHYAKDHTGICIGIKVNYFQNTLSLKIKNGYVRPIAGINNFIPAIYINYCNDKPKPYNLFTGSQKDIEEYLYTKSKDWEYEQEMRMIIHESLIINNPICIEKTEIYEIIFGLKTPNILKEKVIDIIKRYPKNGNWINIYKCNEVKGKYAIEKVKL